MPGPFGFIIAIEKIRIVRIKQAIASNMVAQQEGLEEPAGVSQMPFCRGRIIHRLRGRVGVTQASYETNRKTPDIVEPA